MNRIRPNHKVWSYSLVLVRRQKSPSHSPRRSAQVQSYGLASSMAVVARNDIAGKYYTLAEKGQSMYSFEPLEALEPRLLASSSPIPAIMPRVACGPAIVVQAAALVNGATLVSQSANPTNLAPGASFTKTWTFVNTGTAPWAAGYMGCTLNRQSGSLGVSSTVLQLSSSVPVGKQATFSVQLTVPLTAGTFTDTWQLNGPNPSGGYGHSFGPTVTVQAMVVNPLVNGATLVSQSANPTNLAPGASFTKTWTFVNTGTAPWAAGYTGCTLTFKSGAMIGASKTILTLPYAVPVGGQYTFSMPLTAPTAPGTVTGTWQMTGSTPSGGASMWFGPAVTVQATVVNALVNGATLVAQSANPSGLTPGQVYCMSYTFMNTGTTIWTPGSQGYTFKLVGGNQMGGPSVITLANPVPPNGQVTFNLQLVAPCSTGCYAGSWQLNAPSPYGGTYFGPAVTVQATVVSPLAWGRKVSPDFAAKVRQIASQLSVDPNNLMAVMAFETGETFSPAVKNPSSGAVGLIQFTASTAASLGTSTSLLAQMTAIQQLDYVAEYLAPYRGRLANLGDLYMAVLWPAGIGMSDNYVCFSNAGSAQSRLAYQQNQGLDANGDGKVTRLEAITPVLSKLQKGLQAPYYG